MLSFEQSVTGNQQNHHRVDRDTEQIPTVSPHLQCRALLRQIKIFGEEYFLFYIRCKEVVNSADVKLSDVKRGFQM